MNEFRTNSGQDEIEIDFGKMFRYYLNHWKNILVSGIVLAVLTLAFTYFFVTPMYRASVTLYVNNSMGQQNVTEVNGQSLATAQRLVNTYVNLLSSNSVLQDVVKKGGLDCTVKEIRRGMTAKQIENTEMFRVTVENADPETAAEIANAIARVAPSSISNFIEGSSTKVVDFAVAPRRPFSPSYKKNALFGGLAGVLLMGLLLTFQYIFDMRLTEEDDINSYFTEPVLGTIPEFSAFENKKGEGR